MRWRVSALHNIPGKLLLLNLQPHVWGVIIANREVEFNNAVEFAFVERNIRNTSGCSHSPQYLFEILEYAFN